MGRPLILMRSRTSNRCGDEKKPVLKPCWRRMLSQKAHVEPFPFVPVTWITDNVSRRSRLRPDLETTI